MIACLTGAVKAVVNLIEIDHGDIGIVFEEDYFHSESYIRENSELVEQLVVLTKYYKSEKNILAGKTISKTDLGVATEDLYWDYQEFGDYDDDLSEKVNRENFEKVYQNEIEQEKNRLINRELNEYRSLLRQIEQKEYPIYYAALGDQTYTNSEQMKVEDFKSYPAYMIYEENKRELYPSSTYDNKYLDWIIGDINTSLSTEEAIYIGFPEKALNAKINEWTENKNIAITAIYQLAGFLLGFVMTFIYLMIVSGRAAFHDKKVYLSPIDSLFVDLNIIITGSLVVLYIYLLSIINYVNHTQWIILVSIPISTFIFMLLFSLIRHIKNRTFFKHTLIYLIIHPFVNFFKNVYDSGNLAVKTVLIVIGYPLLIAMTFFMFPVTIGVAAWFAFKKVQAFHTLKNGIEKIKEGDLQHQINIEGNGKFSQLAGDINVIAEGLDHAVSRELKSERLKAELITNVSHDIRTPLTSIITYVDLLKTETDPVKIQDYIDVLEQKSERLKLLTDDLFDAAKASSGSVPVNLEQIEVYSLITQGLGEMSDQIEEKQLEFKFNHPHKKLYLLADGKLLWRSIENILSNIFKYSLKQSRVYVDIEDLGDNVLLTFKNISAYELNISTDELMERFKRGDESRTTTGSGLGLSITESLIDMQHGKFEIDIDGDLFKAMISMPKYPPIN